MNLRNIQSSRGPLNIKEFFALHKNGDELPVWLVWKHEGWFVQLVIRSGARDTRADGVLNGRLKIFVKAPPIEGRANQTIIAAIAEAVDTAKSQVQLVSGLKSKQKSIRLELPREAGARLSQQLASIGH